MACSQYHTRARETFPLAPVGNRLESGSGGLGNLAGQGVGKLILAREYYEQKTSLGWGQFSGGVQMGHLWDYK